MKYKKPTGKKYKRKDQARRSYIEWKSNLKTKYGLTEEDYAEMYDRQSGVCAICLKECERGWRLCVDHCHATGRVRGLLCQKCNRFLGVWDDDLFRFRQATRYLEDAGHKADPNGR